MKLCRLRDKKNWYIHSSKFFNVRFSLIALHTLLKTFYLIRFQVFRIDHDDGAYYDISYIFHHCDNASGRQWNRRSYSLWNFRCEMISFDAQFFLPFPFSLSIFIILSIYHLSIWQYRFIHIYFWGPHLYAYVRANATASATTSKCTTMSIPFMMDYIPMKKQMCAPNAWYLHFLHFFRSLSLFHALF